METRLHSCLPPRLEAHPGTTDLLLVARDGRLEAHQAVLARHSPSLRKMFRDQGGVRDVQLQMPRIRGLPPTLKVEREAAALVTVLLPGYTIRTLTALVELLYRGQNSDTGDIDEGGQLQLLDLYRDLGVEPEYGGLPHIQELEEVLLEVEHVGQDGQHQTRAVGGKESPRNKEFRGNNKLSDNKERTNSIEMMDSKELDREFPTSLELPCSRATHTAVTTTPPSISSLGNTESLDSRESLGIRGSPDSGKLQGSEVAEIREQSEVEELLSSKEVVTVTSTTGTEDKVEQVGDGVMDNIDEGEIGYASSDSISISDYESNEDDAELTMQDNLGNAAEVNRSDRPKIMSDDKLKSISPGGQLCERAERYADITKERIRRSADVIEGRTKSPVDVIEERNMSPVDATEERTESPVDASEERTKSPVDSTEERTASPVDTTEERTMSPGDATEERTMSSGDTATEERTKSPVDATEERTESPAENIEELLGDGTDSERAESPIALTSYLEDADMELKQLIENPPQTPGDVQELDETEETWEDEEEEFKETEIEGKERDEMNLDDEDKGNEDMENTEIGEKAVIEDTEMEGLCVAGSSSHRLIPEQVAATVPAKVRKKICLEKKTEPVPEPPTNLQLLLLAKTDMRKRRRSSLGEVYDEQIKAKKGRSSKTTSRSNSVEKPRTEESLSQQDPAGSFNCPVSRCGSDLKPGTGEHCRTYYIAKHLINNHLRRAPCRLYEDSERSSEVNRFFCTRCAKGSGYSTGSFSSYQAHMALEHRDLHKRLATMLDRGGLGREEAGVYEAVNIFWSQIWGQWREEQGGGTTPGGAGHETSMEEQQESGKSSEGDGRVEKAARVTNEVGSQPKKRKTKSNSNPAIDLVDCRTCGTKTKSWGFLKQHVVNVHLANRAEVYFSCQGDSFGCEYGQDCGYIAKSKQAVRMHLCNIHHVVSEQEIIEVATNFKQLVHTEAEDGSRKETVVSLVRRHSQENVSYSGAQDCKVRLTNILQEPDERSTVLDISNYEVIRTSPNSLGTSVGQNTMYTAPESEKHTCTPTAAKRKVSRTKLDLGPALFTSPEIVKKLSTPMKTSLTKPETIQSSPNLDPCKSVPHQDREKSKKLDSSNEKEQSKDGLDGMMADEYAKYTCKWCFHKYTDTPDLKKHLLETHRDKFVRLHLLEAGEKFYECSLGCQPCFKHKSKEYYMKHLKKVHNEVVLELVELEDAWRELLDWKQFCSRQSDDSLEHLGQPWVPPPIKQRTRGQPELVVIEDEDVETGSREVVPKTAGGVTGTLPEEVVTPEKVVPAEVGLAVRMEEKEEAASTEGPVVLEVMAENVGSVEKRSNIGNETSKVETPSRHKEDSFVCQVCDQSFTAGGEVSLHMFQCHLRGLSSVWTPLVGRAPSSAWPHSWLCLLCDNTFLSRKLAQLHIYTESAHKRRLKKSMEERAENWQHTLEFVRYKVAAEMLEESDSDEGSGGELASGEVVTGGEPATGEVVTGGESATGEVVAGEELGSGEVDTSMELGREEAITFGQLGDEEVVTGGELGSGEVVTGGVMGSGDVVTSSTAEPTFSRQKIWAEAFGAEEPLDYEPEEPDDDTEEPEEPAEHIAADPHLEDGEIKEAAATSSPFNGTPEPEENLPKVKKEAASKDAKQDPQVTERPAPNQVRGSIPEDAMKCQGPVDGPRTDRTEISLQELPCSHTRSGCSRVLTSRPALHKHARACRFRPRVSWPCDVSGCGKRYYYEDDYLAHRQKCLNMQYFQCQDCEYNAVTSREIISHKMESHLQRLQ